MMNTLNRTIMTLAVGGLFLLGSAAAQTATSNTNSSGSGAGAGVHDSGHPRVNQVNRREARQQGRIQQGVNNGKLNPRQDARLEKGETRLVDNQRKDMAADNGHLTKADQRQLNHEANNMNKRIYSDKQVQ